ncbi:MAG: phosphomannomutase/phosphoglucomutase [Kiritimatiellae bacterium]|jgi:phosphomannomutase|nr:phosphomannomutase/phosphoglucomutase [Kiritimatiellia bacterium]
MSFFKAYDMRGVFDVDFDLKMVYEIGRWLPVLLDSECILIGRDVRNSSEDIFEALCRGMTESGCDVHDMGLATTPMVYYFTAKNGYSASIQITASHNPKEYNGMKVSRKGALPVGYDTGLAELEKHVLSGELPPVTELNGVVRKVYFRDEFVHDLRKDAPCLSGLKVGVDCSNGMASLVIRDLLGDDPIYINEEMDGDFPAHAPNPLEVHNCAQLMKLVKEQKLDVGVIFDGDADRVMFVDERGEFVQPDYLIAVLAQRFLRKEPGCTVIHDIRTSRGVIESLQAAGARTVIGRVGHAYAKILMRETGAACGGELAGHYYFRDFYFCDSGELAALMILAEIAAAKRGGKSFSALVAPICRYANSGEMNFQVMDKQGAINTVMKALESFGEPQKSYDFDGYRVEFDSWWLNVRQSNTEPYLRLIIEAADQAELDQRKEYVIEAMKDFIKLTN